MGDIIRRGGKVHVFTPVVTAGAYAANQCVGTLFEIPGATLDSSGLALVKSCLGLSKSKADPALTLVLFSQKPSSTYTDNAACNPSAADLALITGVVKFGATWVDFASNSVSQTPDLDAVVRPLPLDPLNPGPQKSTSLWGLLVVTSGTPTFGSTSDLTVKIALEQY